MNDEKRRPSPGQMYWTEDDEDVEIAEVTKEFEDETFVVADEDGEEAVIKWNVDSERWEVDV